MRKFIPLIKNKVLFNKEKAQILGLEQPTIAEWQGAIEGQKLVAKPTGLNVPLFLINRIILAITFCCIFPLIASEYEIEDCASVEFETDRPMSLFIRRMNLDQAIAITLRNQREIQISQMQIAEQRGVVQNLAGPFDPLLGSDLTHIITDDRQDFPTGTRSDLPAHETIIDAKLTKQTRIGTRFTFFAEVDQIIDPLEFLVGNLPAVKSNQGTISFLIEQPVLSGFLYGNDVTLERASKRDLLATILDNLFLVSQKIKDTTSAYWEVISAQEVVRIREENLERFRVLRKNTEKLIYDEEIAKADILQPEVQVAQGEVDLILAKQNLYAAIQDFLFSMGIAQDGLCLRIDDKIDADFPPIQEDLPMLFSQVDNYIKYGSYARTDIQASKVRQSAAAILVQGGYNALLPKLDLFAGVTKYDFYTNAKANPLYRPLNMNQPQTDYIVGLHFSYPIGNNAAQGTLYQRKAILQQLNLITQQLVQTTYQQILDTWSDLISISQALKQNAIVVDKNRKLVENEQKKLKEGFSTLFVLIDFQNRLANAQIESADLKKKYMQNIAILRFLTGTLIIPNRCLDCYRVEDVLTLPKIDLDPWKGKFQCQQRGYKK